MKNQKRSFNSDQLEGSRLRFPEISIHHSDQNFREHQSVNRVRQSKQAQGTSSEKAFFVAFESYENKTYEELIASESNNDYIPIPVRISTKEQKAPFKLAKVIRYLSASAAFVLVLTSLFVFKPFSPSRRSADLDSAVVSASDDYLKQDISKLVHLKKGSAIKILNRSKSELTLTKSKLNNQDQVKRKAKALFSYQDKTEAYLSANIVRPVKVAPAATFVTAIPKATTATETQTTETSVPEVKDEGLVNQENKNTGAIVQSSDVQLKQNESKNLNETKVSEVVASQNPVQANTKPVEVTSKPSPSTEIQKPVDTQPEMKPPVQTTPTVSAAPSAPAETQAPVVNEPKPNITPETEAPTKAPVVDQNPAQPAEKPQSPHTEEEMKKLYHLIAAEAAPNWDYEGQLRIARVVANRLNSGRYGNTLTDVIEYPNQFTPVGNGTYLSKKPTDLQIQAANDAMNGAGADIFDDKVIGFCTKQCYETNDYFRNELDLVEEYNGVMFFKFKENN